MILAIATAPKRNSRHWRNGTIEWSELVGWMGSPADKKEAGNYILGTLNESTEVHTKGGQPCVDFHRRKHTIASRSAITLDLDTPDPDFVDAVEMLFDHAAIIHTTYSHAPDKPHYRMIVPTDREMAPDEYITAAQALIQQFGKHQFDPGSTQPERFMFKPAAQEPGWFQFWVLDGDPVPVETLLADFVEDLSDKPLPKPGKNKRDPYTLDGIMGAFNRAYAEDWDSLIEAYDLPYEKIAEDRYHLIGATAAAGMGPVQGAEAFVFSHHANDPAYGVTCSAWDLVRLHKFGDMDEDVTSQTPPNRRPSHAAMAELATADNRAMAEMVGIDFAEAFDEDGNANDWRLNLRRNNRGVITNVVANRDLIRDNDPALKVMYLNEMSMVIEADADLPWREVHERDNVIDKADRAEFLEYLAREYGMDVPENHADRMINIAGSRRRRHPAQEYLQNLSWDGVSRIETALPGVRATPYTRMVSRKVLVAAAARVLEPGIKWDHTLVLFGSEGLGKSWWIEKMAKGWSASLGRINDKDTLMAMRAAWIITADEGHSLRKADNDALKEFITRTHDSFRAPYDTVFRRHPRHSVIWSTTNDEVFLRRQEGNRRYLIVRSEDKVDFDAVTDEYVDQVWAEAVVLFEAGERLYLDGLESLEAAEQREHFVEEDAYGGIIEGYLSLPVPEDWDDMNVDKRREWMFGFREGMESAGDGRIDKVCTAQIWVEAMDRRKGDAKRTDLLDIYNALLRLPDWERIPGKTWLNRDYGNQAVFVRKGTEA